MSCRAGWVVSAREGVKPDRSGGGRRDSGAGRGRSAGSRQVVHGYVVKRSIVRRFSQICADFQRGVAALGGSGICACRIGHVRVRRIIITLIIAAIGTWLVSLIVHVRYLAVCDFGSPSMVAMIESLWLVSYSGLGLSACAFVWALGCYLAFSGLCARHLARWAGNLCQGCGYDLRASKERCPECGERIAEG